MLAKLQEFTIYNRTRLKVEFEIDSKQAEVFVKAITDGVDNFKIVPEPVRNPSLWSRIVNRIR